MVAEVMAAEAAQVSTSSSNLLNDTQYQVLPSQNPGVELTMLSGDPLHCVFPVAPPEGEKTLSVLSLPEREKTLCEQSPLGGRPCVYNPHRRGERLCVYSPHLRGERLRVYSPHQRGKNSVCTVSGYIQSSSVQKCIYSRKSERSASGGQTKAVPSGVGKTWVVPVDHRAHKRYKLPFRQCPNLSRVPCIISSYTGFDKQNAFWTSIQDLLKKGAVEVVHTPESLGFYSHLFLVPKPGNRWRPVIDLSSVNKFLAIPKFKMETPESIHASLRKGGWVTSHRRLPTCTYSHPVSKIPQVSFQRLHLPVHQPPIRASNSPPHFHQYCQRGKTDSFAFRNPPITG